MKDHQIQLDAIEAFLRRASLVDRPFMVKGSIITRQYFPDPTMRYVADLDWVYLPFVDRDEAAGKVFSEWTTEITEMDLDDGARFRSFKENDFWRYIDYAMNDDFPTVDTDLICWINGEMNDRLGLDISYNLDIDYPPVEMIYQPRVGESFVLKNTCPLPLQVSWKLHQLLVRPRVKDVFDLIYLVRNSNFTTTILHQCLAALKKECDRDDIDVKTLRWYINDNVATSLNDNETKTTNRYNFWGFLRKRGSVPNVTGVQHLDLDDHKHFTKAEHFQYKKLSELFRELGNALRQSGFSEAILQSL